MAIVRKRKFRATCLSGALGELECASALLHRGFFVYRNVAASGRNDLVCEYAGRLYGVQVKFRQPEIRGGNFIIKTGGITEYERTDIVCFVGGIGRMIFETSRPELARVLNCESQNKNGKGK